MFLCLHLSSHSQLMPTIRQQSKPTFHALQKVYLFCITQINLFDNVLHSNSSSDSPPPSEPLSHSGGRQANASSPDCDDLNQVQAYKTHNNAALHINTMILNQWSVTYCPETGPSFSYNSLER